MSVATADAFVDLLRRYRLLEPAQLDEVERTLAGRFPQPKDLARELVQRGWITPFQINQLFQNRGQDLALGSYVLLERIGEGGMGAVYKARNWKLGRVVAIKVIRKDRLANPEAVRRFQREIRAAAQLNHPNIVRAFDADEVDGAHLLVMEYVEGAVDLAGLVKKQGPFPIAEACAAIRQAALGLQHAMEQGLVHRDIKPQNLLLTRDRVVKILDMGLARLREEDKGDESTALTQEGAIMGTLDYMAPEQARESHRVDIRADLYSLGCTLFFLLTGRVPFPGGGMSEKLMKHQIDAPPSVGSLRPDTPAGVGAIVAKLLAKRPEDRFQTPGELAAALEMPEAYVPTNPVGSTLITPGAAPVPNLFADMLDKYSQSAPTLPLPEPRPAATPLPWKWLAAGGGGLLCLIVLLVILIRAGNAPEKQMVELDPRPLPKKDPLDPNPKEVEPKPPSDADRRAAEWVLDIGSYLGIAVAGKDFPFKTIADLPNTPFTVKYINVNRNPRVSDEALVVLKELRNLTYLQISNSPATDTALSYVKDCKTLETLHLHSTRITDAGLVHLEGLPALKLVGLRKTAVSEAAMHKLAAALPKCQIDWNGGVIGPTAK